MCFGFTFQHVLPSTQSLPSGVAQQGEVSVPDSGGAECSPTPARADKAQQQQDQALDFHTDCVNKQISVDNNRKLLLRPPFPRTKIQPASQPEKQLPGSQSLGGGQGRAVQENHWMEFPWLAFSADYIDNKINSTLEFT